LKIRNLKTFCYRSPSQEYKNARSQHSSIAFNACACWDKHGEQIVKRACRSNLELLAAITSIPAIFVLALKMISNDFERVANARYNERTTSEIINHWHSWSVFDCKRLVEKPRREKVRDPLTITYAVGVKNSSSDERRDEEKKRTSVTRKSRARKQDHVEEGFCLETTGFRPDSMHKGFINFPGPWKFTPLPVRELLPHDSSRSRKMNRPGWVVP